MIEEIYTSSSKYLRPTIFSKQHLWSRAELETFLYQFKDSKDFENYNDFFHYWISLQKTERNKAGTRIDPGNNIFEYIVKLIYHSTESQPLMIRGATKLGKSVFLNFLYDHFLCDLVQGNSDYIPVYINMEICDAEYGSLNGGEGENSFELWERQCITQMLERGKHLSQSYEKPVCYFMDGMRQHIFYNGQIENTIEQLSREYLCCEYGQNKIVYCIDTNDTLSLPNTLLNGNRDAEYVLYFNQLTVNSFTSKKKFDDAIYAFCKLYGIQSQKDTILQNIDCLHLQSVDLEFLVRFREKLSSCMHTPGIAELYDGHRNDIFNVDITEDAAKACYLLYHEKQKFDQIEKSGVTIGRDVFEIIRTQQGIALLLLAYCYLEEIKNPQEYADPSESPLNAFYGHTECVYIRELICFRHEQQALLNFEKTHYKDLSDIGKSTITYLCGRTSDHTREQMQERLDWERKQLTRKK